MKAKRFLEELYGITLSKKGPYHRQMEAINTSGKLGNKADLGKIIFWLCEQNDQMDLKIQSLETQLSMLIPSSANAKSPRINQRG